MGRTIASFVRNSHPMPATSSSPNPSAEARLAGWLLVAVLLHAMLLLIPSQQGPRSGKALERLTVSLRYFRPAELLSSVPAPAVEKPPTPVSKPAVAQQPDRPMPTPLTPPATAESPPVLSAARLLDLATRRDWQLPNARQQREPGMYSRQAMPPSWRRGMPREKNRFEGLVAPAEVETVDRWLAADGSHNVVITTPNGDTYCGRVGAWNPMSPLFEPVMMFRTCGGGGKRTFDMPHHYRKDATRADRP